MTTMVTALCSGYFPVHLNFEDLEQRRQHSGNIIFVDFAAKRPLRATALSALRHFLRDQESDGKILSDKIFEGFCFVEAVYTVFQCSRMDRQPVKIDILSSLFSMLIHSAKEVLQYAQTSDQSVDTRAIAQNNLRLCTFFLGHLLCIIEDMQPKPPPRKEMQDKFLKAENVNDFRYLELKSSAFSLLWNILQMSEEAIVSPHDIGAAREIISGAAVSCLIHQKWGDRGIQAKATLEVLRKAILGILSDSFTRHLSFAHEVPQQRFTSLMNLCVKHKHLIPFMADFIKHLMICEELAGISFISQVVKIVTEKCAAAADGEKTGCMQDEIESAMTLLADFSIRHDAVVLMGLHLGSLLQTLRNERAAIRKCFSVIAGCCLKRYDVLSPADQHILAQIHEVLSRDRDATCRLRVLTNLGSDLKWVHCSNDQSILLLISVVSKRVLDKSKMVRLKAIQILEAIFLDTKLCSLKSDSPLHEVMSMAPAMFLKFSKLLAISLESSYFCKDTLEAVGRLFCFPCLKGPLMFELLDNLLYFSLTSSNLTIISHIFNFHLDGYEIWVNFLMTRTEPSITKLQDLMLMTVDIVRSEINIFYKLIEQTFGALEQHCILEMENAAIMASCVLVAILLPLDCFTLSDVKKKGCCLIGILVKFMEKGSNSEVTKKTDIKKQIIKWAFKALAVLLKGKSKILENEVKRFIEDNFLYLQENKVDGYLDCLYSLSNPLSLVKKILHTYEEQYRVLETVQPLKVLYIYITFLGDISRNYELACSSFIKCLQKVEMDLCKPIFGTASSQFDYLQQDELKAMKEDAVARFTQMLLDGDSVPGCYVPFLRELVQAENLPVDLRVAATKSLGQYMLTSSHLAKDHKDMLEFLFHSEILQLKVTALSLAEKLIITFPNDFSSAITLIESCLGDERLKELAYCAYVRLLLEDKFKLEILLTPICDGLCEANENVKTIIIFLLKKLLRNSGRSKIKSVVHLYNHTAKPESQHRLVEVLVEELLENEDLQSDELANSILQLLAKGKNDAAFFASFLNPSSKVLNTMLSYLKASPPKIFVQGDTEIQKYLIKFVTNHKRQGPTAAEKDLIDKLLDILGTKPRKKRKGAAKTEAASYMSLEEYEEAIETFKNCQITSSLWDILRMDV